MFTTSTTVNLKKITWWELHGALIILSYLKVTRNASVVTKDVTAPIKSGSKPLNNLRTKEITI